MRVLVRESIADAGVDLLRSKFEVDDDQVTPLEEIIDRYDAIVIRSATQLTADLIERATNLKMIGRAGVGVDNVDVDAATRRGIVVANAPESTVVSAAEQTVGLMVALARNIPQAHAALKQGRWERSKWGGVELQGKTLGVLGFGRIGQQVARRAIGLGMNVVAYDPFVAEERFRELGVEYAIEVDDVLGAADFLTLHSPLTDETREMINGETIAKMKDGARIVNAARGALIDEEALAEALTSGKLAGAALDVFPSEPITDYPLFDGYDNGLMSIALKPAAAGMAPMPSKAWCGALLTHIRNAVVGEICPTARFSPITRPRKPYHRIRVCQLTPLDEVWLKRWWLAMLVLCAQAAVSSRALITSACRPWLMR